MSKNQGRSVPISVSQNFLTSRKTIDHLLRLTSINKNDTVLEIGAGKGHITKALLDKCSRVIASEIDEKLYRSLRSTLSGNNKLTLTSDDFLKSRLPRFEYKVFSNIPFSLTTDIVRKLTQSRKPPREAWLVMEKGAAKRFCGKPGDTLQSLQLKPFYNLSVIYHFRREDFHPKPRVDVVLLHISQKASPDFPPSERKAYNNFIMHGHNYGVFGKRALLSKQQIRAALSFAKLDPILPGGDILYIQWLCLFRCWQTQGQHQ